MTTIIKPTKYTHRFLARLVIEAKTPLAIGSFRRERYHLRCLGCNRRERSSVYSGNCNRGCGEKFIEAGRGRYGYILWLSK